MTQNFEAEKQKGCEGVKTEIEGVKRDIEKLSQRFDLLPDNVVAKLETATRKSKGRAPGTPVVTKLAPRSTLQAPGPPIPTTRVSE